MALSPEFVHRQLRAATGRFRWSRAGRYLVSGVIASLFFLILFLLCDTSFHLGLAGRWTGFLLVVAPVVAGVAKALPAWLHPLSELAIARRIETACPGSGNALVNAVQFDGELARGSALRAAVFNELSDPFPRVNWAEVFDLALIKRLALALGVAGLIVLGWAMARPAAFLNSVSRVFLPGSRIAPLTRTRLDALSPGNTSVMHGSEVELSVGLGGEVPRAAWVRYREAGASWRRELMSHEVGTNGFGFRWKDIRQPVEYYVEAGDLETPVYAVTVRALTSLSARTVQIEPPAYTGLPKTSVADLGALMGVLPGSKLTFTLDFNNPVEGLTASDDKTPAYPVEKVDDRRWHVTVPFAANTTVALAFHDQDAVAGRQTIPISARPDEPPKLNVIDPAEGRQLVATADASLGVRFAATDDFGLGAAGLYLSTNDKPDAELVQDFPAAVGQKTFSGEAKVALARYLKPGADHLTFCVVARDQQRRDRAGGDGFPSRSRSRSTPPRRCSSRPPTPRPGNWRRSLRELLKLQETNLDGTRAAIDAPATGDARPCKSLLTRQVAAGELAGELVTAAEGVAPETREVLRSLVQQEMPAAVLSLRNAASAAPAARGSSARRRRQAGEL